MSQHPLPSARCQPHPLIPPNKATKQGETKNPEKKTKPPTNCIVLPWPTCTEHKARVDCEPNPERGSDKINMLSKRRRNTAENKLYTAAWIYKELAYKS